jgi:hypothetical protein
MTTSEKDAVLETRLIEAINKIPFMDSQGGGPLLYRSEVNRTIRRLLRESHLPELLVAGEKIPHQTKYVKGAGFGGATAKMCKENCARCTWDAAKAAFLKGAEK